MLDALRVASSKCVNYLVRQAPWPQGSCTQAGNHIGQSGQSQHGLPHLTAGVLPDEITGAQSGPIARHIHGLTIQQEGCTNSRHGSITPTYKCACARNRWTCSVQRTSIRGFVQQLKAGDRWVSLCTSGYEGGIRKKNYSLRVYKQRTHRLFFQRSVCKAT